MNIIDILQDTTDHALLMKLIENKILDRQFTKVPLYHKGRYCITHCVVTCTR